ncbi:hypothetical protein L915_04618 [Phytophthora nicotianae]|uniref:N-acetyltransferase domain-containing protein n=1 Tax=Phytophthora nicotianae TaxID=4792 RepID=W2HBI4_PHYNI|nr:hypothetical protein L915_04618 [Phytophthora nicotianae]
MITINTLAVVAMIAVNKANASYVRRLTDDDSGSLDFDSSGDDSASFLEELFTSEAGDTVSKFGQCGGIGYVGNSQCAQGYVCVLSNPWYAQCLPKGSQTSVQTKKHRHRSKLHTADADLLVDDLTADVEVIPAWEQCGGKGVDFDFTKDDLDDNETPKKPCEEGYSCEIINEWYYQCKPLDNPSGVHLWDQCGGEDYTGPEECTAGSVCKFFNSWYSQCVPKEQEFSDLSSIARIFCETSLLLDEDKTFEYRWAAIAEKCVATDLADIPSSYIAPGGNFWVALQRVSETEGEVKRVSVDTKHHRKGIGRKLMNQVESWAVANAIKTLSLSTGVKSKKSIAFYVSLGYELQPCSAYPTLFKDPPYFELCTLIKKF